MSVARQRVLTDAQPLATAEHGQAQPAPAAMAMRRRALDALARCLQARPGPSRLGSHPPLPAAPAAGAARPSSSGRLPPEYERYYGHLPPPTPSKQAVEAGQRLAPPPPPTPGGGQASASTQRETAQAGAQH